jgi:Leucine-rich repeat (LRR) protein
MKVQDSLDHGTIGCALAHVTEYVLDWEKIEEDKRESIAFPAEVWKFRNLKKLTIRCCPHSTLPSDIENLEELTELILEECEFSSLPSCVGRLSSLQTLKIDRCAIETLPAEIGQLESLKTFIIVQSDNANDENSLEFPAEELVKLKQVEEVEFEDYRFPIPIEELGSMKSLKRLTLDSCDMQGGQELSASIDQLQNLDHLSIVYCSNLESLPVEIGQLTNLKSLVCLTNSLSSDVPSEIGNLTQLETLEIDFCSLPRTVGDLENLKHLRLHHLHDDRDANRMEEIDSVIGRLSQLESLKLSWVTHAFKLPFLRHLKSLVLHKCHTDSVLQAFEDLAWKEAGSLEHLSIEGYPWGCLSYTKIPRGLPSTLKTFEMTSCGGTNTSEGFAIEGFPIGIQHIRLHDVHHATINPFQPYVFSDKDRSCVRSLLEKHWQLCDLYATGIWPLSEYDTYLMKLNMCGRYLVKRDGSAKSVVPLSMWPIVLAKVHKQVHNSKKKSDRYRTREMSASVVYHFLREGSALLGRSYHLPTPRGGG